MILRGKFTLLFALLAAATAPLVASAGWREFLGLAPTVTERPPQFIALAFDGSLNNAFWEESLTFGKENQVPFTYFASGVYFLLDENKSLYTEPRYGVGKSAIGWGGKSADHLIQRMGYLKRAYAEGNEIGSHANGHFDGTSYTYDQWKFEFSQFPKLIFDAFINNKVIPPKGFDLGFGMDEVKGFRAPLLGRGPPLYEVLSEAGFHYDTSKTASMNYWPEKEKGLWNFPLAIVNIAGTAKRTISMDYNFFYFMNNYNGNRAPIHIGHHFAKWNNAAYWTAMKTFAKTVCGLPEVRCVTYKALTDFMESRTPDELAALKLGSFPKGESISLPPVLSRPAPIAFTASISDPNAPHIAVNLAGQDADAILADPALRVDWKLDGVAIGSGTKIPTARLQSQIEANSVLSVALHSGNVEILRTSRKVSKTLFRDLIVVNDVDLESQALQGDLPAAHFHTDEIEQ
jgi:peptidoglycan/xylan/chitin deacetylase (PgdA/CDA1 family)